MEVRVTSRRPVAIYPVLFFKHLSGEAQAPEPEPAGRIFPFVGPLWFSDELTDIFVGHLAVPSQRLMNLMRVNNGIDLILGQAKL